MWYKTLKVTLIRENKLDERRTLHKRLLRNVLYQLLDTISILWLWSISHTNHQRIQSYGKRWRSIAVRFMYQEDNSADLPIYVDPAMVGSSIKFTVRKSPCVLGCILTCTTRNVVYAWDATSVSVAFEKRLPSKCFKSVQHRAL